MYQVLNKLKALTPGERSLVLAYLAVALFGVAFGLVVVLRLDPAALFSRGMTVYEYWILVSGALGVCFALHLSRERLGLSGFVNAAIGIGLMTFFAPVIAGTLALPVYGTMFAPMTLLIIFWVAPIVAVLWFTSLTGVHFMLKSWQEERDSIYDRPETFAKPTIFETLLRDLRMR